MGAITIGVDINRRHNLTAVAVVESARREGADEKSEIYYEIRHLEQMPNGTHYVPVGERLAEIIDRIPRPSGGWSHLPGFEVRVNTTVVGQPVAEFLQGRVRAERM